ncbi:MAG: PAS domain-containing protein, partial [Spirochaetales bacterium]|nr:PAS domain-containing protein [Spirochaetales bacterium]
MLRNENIFKMLVESAPDGIIVVDEGGAIVVANRRAREIFGYDREALVGLPFDVLFPDRFEALYKEYTSSHPSS